MAGTWLVGGHDERNFLSVYSAFSCFSKESSVHTVAAVARGIEKRQTMGVRSPGRV